MARRGPLARRLFIAASRSMLAFADGTAQVDEKAVYRPQLSVSEMFEPFLKQLEPGHDAFPLERQAQELEARLRELSDAFRSGAARVAGITTQLLDPSFRGARLIPVDDAAAESGAARREARDGSAARGDARRPRVRRGVAAARRRLPQRRRRRVPHHRDRTGRSRRSAPHPSAPPSATTSSAPARRRTASSTSASGRWDGGETRRAGRSF